jgi:hypothetical protein
VLLFNCVCMQKTLRTEPLKQLLADKGSAGEHYIHVSAAYALLNNLTVICGIP